MKEKEDSYYVLRQTSLVGFVVLLVFAAGASFYVGRVSGPVTTETVASTTIVSSSIQTVTSMSTTTFSTEVAIVSTYTTYQTINAESPKTIHFAGQASTKTPATAANTVRFVGIKNGSYSAQVAGGQYSISVPNTQAYEVWIDYSITPTGAGQCSSGAVFLPSSIAEWTVNYSC